jgi:hypothetical protein
MAVVTIAAGLVLAGYGRNPAVLHAKEKEVVQAKEKEHPAKVEKIEGSDLSRVILTAKAMQRLDLKTDEVREQRVPRSASPRRVVPYSSLIYDPKGQTWVYTSPQPGTFVRHRVDVDFIDGDLVVLKDGPPKGTVIAAVGVAELYGTEFGVGH